MSESLTRRAEGCVVGKGSHGQRHGAVEIPLRCGATPIYSSSGGTGFQDESGLKRSIFLNSSRVPGPRSFS
jgi:hypothetical protein